MTRDLDTETRILQAARSVFMRHGTNGARVQDIAAEAGVNQALVHYYFGTKEKLAERVFREAATHLARAVTPVPRPGQSLEEMIREFVVGYIGAVRQFPFIPSYLLAEAHQRPERLEALMESAIGAAPSRIGGAVRSHLDAVLAQGIAAGTVRPMSTRQLMVNVMSLAVFPFVARPLLSLALGFDEAEFDRFLDERLKELPDFILTALRP